MEVTLNHQVTFHAFWSSSFQTKTGLVKLNNIASCMTRYSLSANNTSTHLLSLWMSKQHFVVFYFAQVATSDLAAVRKK